MRRWLIVLAVGCGSKSDPAPPRPIVATPTPQPPMLDAHGAKSLTRVDAQTLPAWDVPTGTGSGAPITVYAVDMGSALLAELSPPPIVIPVVTKRVTGRITAPRDLATAAIAAQLDVDLTPPDLKGIGGTLHLDFPGAPTADLLRILVDAGRVNIVAPGSLPALHVRVRGAPWDGLLNAVAAASARTVTRVGNTYYLLPRGVPLPPLPEAAATVVDLEVDGGTLAQATAALGQLVPVPATACTSPAFSLTLKRVSIAEALRALEVASDTKLTRGATCASTALTPKTDTSTLRLVAIARAGTKRAAAFDQAGTTLTALRDGSIVKDIGESFVTFDEDHSLELHRPTLITPPGPAELVATLKRTAAIIKSDAGWSALIEQTDGQFRQVTSGLPPALIDVVRVNLDGVYLEAGGTTAVVPFGRVE